MYEMKRHADDLAEHHADLMSTTMAMTQSVTACLVRYINAIDAALQQGVDSWVGEQTADLDATRVMALADGALGFLDQLAEQVAASYQMMAAVNALASTAERVRKANDRADVESFAAAIQTLKGQMVGLATLNPEELQGAIREQRDVLFRIVGLLTPEHGLRADATAERAERA